MQAKHGQVELGIETEAGYIFPKFASLRLLSLPTQWNDIAFLIVLRDIAKIGFDVGLHMLTELRANGSVMIFDKVPRLNGIELKHVLLAMNCTLELFPSVVDTTVEESPTKAV